MANGEPLNGHNEIVIDGLEKRFGDVAAVNGLAWSLSLPVSSASSGPSSGKFVRAQRAVPFLK